jgi:hypothetical protein
MNSIIDLIAIVIGIILVLMMKDSKDPENEEPPKVESIKIKIEQIEEVYYAWHDDNFIVQSKQIDDVIEHVKKKFPNKNYFIVSNRNLEKWLQTKQKI